MTATRSAGAKKEVQELEKAIKKNGYKLVPSGSGHKKVVDQRGRSVVDKDGPVIVSSSPSEVRWREMHVSRLIKAGVLKEDPWNPEPKERSSGNLRDPAVQAKIRETKAREMAQREERTRRIRSRLEPIVAKVGGWDKSGFVADLGRVYYHLAKTRGRVEAPKNQASAIQNARNLKLGGTLSDNNAVCWELLLDDLEKAGKEPNGLRDRFVDLLREAKGINHSPSLNGAAPIEEEAQALPPVAPAPPVWPHTPARVPSLAMEAAARMGRGAFSEKDFEEALVLAEKLAELELREDQ